MSRNLLVAVAVLALPGCQTEPGIYELSLDAFLANTCPFTLDELFTVGTLDPVPLTDDNNFVNALPTAQERRGIYANADRTARFTAWFSLTLTPTDTPSAYRLWLDESTLTDPVAWVPEVYQAEAAQRDLDFTVCDQLVTQRHVTASGHLRMAPTVTGPSSFSVAPVQGELWGHDNNNHDSASFETPALRFSYVQAPNGGEFSTWPEWDGTVLDGAGFEDGSVFWDDGPGMAYIDGDTGEPLP